MRSCPNCGKEPPRNSNFCNWDCMVEKAKNDGGEVHTPNGLPIKSINNDGSMWEHEHGDHPDYKFPLTVRYVGDKPEEEFAVIDGLGNHVDMGPEWNEARRTREVALIYVDQRIALTMYERCYQLWSLSDGHAVRTGDPGSDLFNRKWRVTDESLEKVRMFSAQRPQTASR